ncbi:DUF488 domain-containing protein [Bifidobacterium xylocopae]|uniref:MarR family transcriptional regulator n=1 Tax=Bifidobacterium xylocopae TaxID=2493119 RepID=A0A366KDW9_9BIFI|nr:DUF488 domain-containing protein [Bifidobacterium xylocopae]RBP99916.1 MarR family transcriptional regulator [Bifidobacterium xylocopae]
MAELRIKRVYERAEGTDGTRVLVDRLWPRGMSKDKARLDLWLKEIAPSSQLRKWWGHDPSAYAEFVRRYRAELDDNPEAVARLGELLRTRPVVTLLYGAKDSKLNQAAVLRDYMEVRAGD